MIRHASKRRTAIKRRGTREACKRMLVSEMFPDSILLTILHGSRNEGTFQYSHEIKAARIITRKDPAYFQ